MATEKKRTKNNKRKTNSDTVTVKRSYYTFSKQYPGGGSSQEYRKVMNDTANEKKSIRIILSIFALLVIVFVGYFTTSVGINISNAPTTGQTENIQTTQINTENTDQSENTSEKPTEPKKAVTQEEPEREVNVTTTKSQTENADYNN